KRKNQDVVVKWFARGKLWDSPEAEHAAQYAPVPPVEKRPRDWRPGGEHKDPRDRFKKKNRPERAWSEEDRDREKAWRPKPSGEGRPPRREGERKPWQNKPSGPPRGDRPWKPKPPGEQKPWQNK